MLDLLENCSRPSGTSGTSEEGGKTTTTANTSKDNHPLFSFDIVNCYVRPNTNSGKLPLPVLVVRIVFPLSSDVPEVSDGLEQLSKRSNTRLMRPESKRCPYMTVKRVTDKIQDK